MPDVSALLEPIRHLHEQISDAVVGACERTEAERLSMVAEESECDTIYAVDRLTDSLLTGFVEREIASEAPVVLIAEGLPGGSLVLPRGRKEAEAAWQIIVDPIDGTRGLMYQKRSAWVLTGVAPHRGRTTALDDIELAVQTEIPLVKQHARDCAWAIRGGGAAAERQDRFSGRRSPLPLRPSTCRTIEHGYAMLVRFFPGARDVLAAIDEEIVRGAIGPAPAGRAHCFEDQYASTGGQLYELMAGRDRFIADLRPLMAPILRERGFPVGLCCHPYDVCTELIAREAGAIITDVTGGPLRAPLDVTAEVAWIGYANEHIRATVEPLLRKALRDRGLID